MTYDLGPAEEWSIAFRKNESLIHLDISYNDFDSKEVEDTLKNDLISADNIKIIKKDNDICGLFYVNLFGNTEDLSSQINKIKKKNNLIKVSQRVDSDILLLEKKLIKFVKNKLDLDTNQDKYP